VDEKEQESLKQEAGANVERKREQKMNFLEFIMNNPEVIIIAALALTVAAFYVFSPRRIGGK